MKLSKMFCKYNRIFTFSSEVEKPFSGCIHFQNLLTNYCFFRVVRLWKKQVLMSILIEVI